jgi:hypothetical protein
MLSRSSDQRQSIGCRSQGASPRERYIDDQGREQIANTRRQCDGLALEQPHLPVPFLKRLILSPDDDPVVVGGPRIEIRARPVLAAELPLATSRWSITTTSAPARASSCAASAPVMPAPITLASADSSRVSEG